MQILFLSRHIDRPTAWILKRLHAEGYKVQVICNSDTANLSELIAAEVPVECAPFRHRFDLTSMRTVRRVLKEGNFSILHSIDARALAVALWASYGFKLSIISYRGAMGRIYRTDPSVYLAHLNPRVAKIVCVSDAVRAVLSKSVPQSKLVTIHKGHDLSWYNPAPRSALYELGIPENALVVSCAANARPHKGVQVLFRALHLVKDPRVHVLFIGHGGEDQALQKAAEGPARDRICFAGYQPNAASLVGATDVFAVPSLREGLARALLEAMAQGVPPIVTAVGGLPEAVIDGKNGTVVPPNDPEALAEAIDRYAASEDLRREHGMAAKERIRNEFNIERTYQKTVELYREF